jgi:opacity protein-like surface antigen
MEGFPMTPKGKAITMKVLCLALAALLALTAPAASAVTITFDDPLPAGFTLSGGQIVQGNVVSSYLQPNDSGSKYLTSTDPNGALLSTSLGYYSVSFDWGTNDTWNTLDLLDRSGNLIESIAGTGTGVNGRFSYTSTVAIGALAFKSTVPAFEVDDVTFESPVPEPASWALMVLGFGAAGVSLRAARRNALSEGTLRLRI